MHYWQQQVCIDTAKDLSCTAGIRTAYQCLLQSPGNCGGTYLFIYFFKSFHAISYKAEGSRTELQPLSKDVAGMWLMSYSLWNKEFHSILAGCN